MVFLGNKPQGIVAIATCPCVTTVVGFGLTSTMRQVLTADQWVDFLRLIQVGDDRIAGMDGTLADEIEYALG